MMFWEENDSFHLEENEVEFHSLCTKLEKHAFTSPWNIFFESSVECTTSVDEVNDANAKNNLKEASQTPIRMPQILNLKESNSVHNIEQNISCLPINEEKTHRIKEVLISAQDNIPANYEQDLEFILILPSHQIPIFFEKLDIANLSEAAVLLLINVLLRFKDKTSVTTATALFRYIICPKILGMKNTSRSLLASIVKFSGTYPKAVIDEVIIPSLKENSLDELLLQIVKTDLPNEYVPYCIKSILSCSIPVENSFTILQCLVERKVYLESKIHELLFEKLQSWSASYNKNIKFTKLLTSIMSTYGNELTEENLCKCEDIIKNNKTIIKKAAENLLKKIRPI